MPQSIPAGLTHQHAPRALADLDAGIALRLAHEGKRDAPKGVVGLASRYSIDRILQPQESSGGAALVEQIQGDRQ